MGLSDGKKIVSEPIFGLKWLCLTTLKEFQKSVALPFGRTKRHL